ncbi:hypothetical protein [Hyphococcus sp.]
MDALILVDWLCAWAYFRDQRRQNGTVWVEYPASIQTPIVTPLGEK